jgi:outer membrane protein
MNRQNYSISLLILLSLIAGMQCTWSQLQPAPGEVPARTLTLEECRHLALEQNRKIKAAKFQMEASYAVQKSVAANALPSVDGSMMGVYLGEPLGGALNGAIPKYFANGSVTVSQAIYAGGKIRYGKQAAEKGTEIHEAQLALTEAEVLLLAEKAYWQVIQGNEKITLATRFKEMVQSLQHDLKNAYDAGLIYKNDLLRVDVTLNEADLNVSRAKDGVVMARLNLAQVMGVPGSTDFILADSVSGTFDVPSAQMDTATAKRPEIILLHKVLQAEELQRKILRADLLPTIGVSASGLAAMGKGVNISDGSNSMTTYYGLANISFPLFDWGKRAGKVKEQSYKISAQQQQLLETNELIQLEIQNAYLQLNHSARKVSNSLLSLQQADENLKLANDRFKAGTIVAKDVQEAQAIWQQAYSNVIDAKIEYKINTATYKKATGERN